MAPAAINGDVNALLDEIKAPAGVVLPPKEIKAILEKTAGYVARNGIVFEDRIREKERSNPKFSFLSPNDAYNAYYLWRLSEIKEGRGNAIAAGRAGEVAAEPEKPKGPPEPPEFHFSARMPNISAQDLEVVRLTALFVAKNGRQFMTTLSQRETGNYQFDFLRPNHSLHNFFQRLIDQYTSLLRAGGMDGEGGKAQQERINQLERNVKDRFNILERARQRAEWLKYQDQQKQKKEEEAEREKLSYASIDWHDFVVVETVLFNEADEQANLPPPTSLSELQFASLDQKAMMSINSNMRIEEAMPTEADSDYSSYNQNKTQAASAHQMQPPPSRSPQPAYEPPRRNPNGRSAEEEEEEESRIRERSEARARAQQAQADAKGAGAPMKIRENYVPRAAALAANKQNASLAICPNCKQKIPFNELDEHLRIELLDSRWKEQRAKAESRYTSSAVLSVDVGPNLKRMANQQSDGANAGLGQGLEEEVAKRKKMAVPTYDGNPDSKESIRMMQNVNVEEQIRAIHQKFGSEKR